MLHRKNILQMKCFLDLKSHAMKITFYNELKHNLLTYNHLFVASSSRIICSLLPTSYILEIFIQNVRVNNLRSKIAA